MCTLKIRRKHCSEGNIPAKLAKIHFAEGYWAKFAWIAWPEMYGRLVRFDTANGFLGGRMARLYVEYCCRASDQFRTPRGKAGTASEEICCFCQSGSDGGADRGLRLESHVGFTSLEYTSGNRWSGCTYSTCSLVVKKSVKESLSSEITHRKSSNRSKEKLSIKTYILCCCVWWRSGCERKEGSGCSTARERWFNRDPTVKHVPL